jgi:Sec-independent protein secretion pathway component TatC
MSFALGERLSSGAWILTAIALAIALPGLDWVTSVFEIVPLIMLFELSIWLSVLFERRWRVADKLAGAET